MVASAAFCCGWCLLLLLLLLLVAVMGSLAVVTKVVGMVVTVAVLVKVRAG